MCNVNFDSIVVASKRLRQINMILLWNDCRCKKKLGTLSLRWQLLSVFFDNCNKSLSRICESQISAEHRRALSSDARIALRTTSMHLTKRVPQFIILWDSAVVAQQECLY